MVKKIAIGGGVVILLLLIGGSLWARSVLAGDGVRTALAAQVSKAIGQPVTIGGITAGMYPRVAVKLGDVRIGSPARMQIVELHVGTDFRALLSRRIEHASLRLSGARIELPLPAFASTTPSNTEAPASGSSPVELVSIDEIVLNDVQVVSGGRTLRGDIEVVPQGNSLLIRKISLTADGATITATGQITDLSGPVGEINLKADTLNFEQLMAFANDFSGGAGLASTPDAKQGKPAPDASAVPSKMSLSVSLQADRATMGTLALEKLEGRARITEQSIALDPIGFGIFGGRYEGTLSLATLTGGPNTPAIKASAKLSGIDVAAATRFAGSPDTISGRLSGRLNFSGRGSDPSVLINNVRGSARIDIVDGIVKNLGLVRGVVVATSMRSGATSQLASGSKDEKFSKLGATLAIANGALTTDDLVFESTDLSLNAQGAVQLSASTLNLKGRVQLSEALSKQAGSDLTRYTQEQGRVTLPATVTGPAAAPKVTIDVGDMAKRALKNAATEQADKLLKGKAGGLSGLFKR